MASIAAFLADPSVRAWYLAVCFALLVLPMIALSVWYHRNIGATAGGRELMERHSSDAWMDDVPSLARDIASGRYGVEAGQMQKRVYWVVGAWLAINAVAFGLLLWADELNRVAA